MAFVAPLLFSLSLAQTPPPVPPPAQKPPAKDTKGKPPEPKPAPKPGDPKPYAEVVTKDAVTQEGMFKVHRIDDRVLFEIPADLLGREFLWQTEVAELPSSVSYGYPGVSLGTRLVRFTRRGHKIYLRNVDYSIRESVGGAYSLAVTANSLEPVLMGFDIQAEGEKKSVVIDVTQFFTSDPPDFSVKSAVGGAGVDPSRSYIDRVKSFPSNVETRSFLTFFAGRSLYGGPSASAVSATVHYSLDLLPEKPMMGRLGDSRVGYFSQYFTEYGRPENRSVERQFIDRFRLEKKDPTAALSEPVKPIVFYLSREVPEKWRPYMKKAVEAWQPAFEQAGFKNAILCKDAPTAKEDPFWDPEDARYSVIRWAPSTTENAMGPSIQDPRSGETLSAHVIVWNDILRLIQNWYFVQASAIDDKAHKLPLPDDLTGDLICYVITHEVGHTLGLEHNMKGSSAYTVKQLRDPKFTVENGLSCSIMDYARFNYVAQPGDGVTRTIGGLGPYDKFAIEYGYKPIPEAKTPDDEKRTLDGLLSRQIADPRLRFGENFLDPTVETEDLGDDPIEATALGLKNLDRIAKNLLVPATTKFGEDYSRLSEVYSNLMNQRLTELMHVVRLIGGMYETDYHAGRGGNVYKPVPAAKQRAAVQFLLDNGLQLPPALLSPSLLYKIQPTGMLSENTTLARAILSSLLSASRVQRLDDDEAVNGASAYTASQLVDDIQIAFWSELSQPKPVVGVYRRALQQAYLKAIDGKVNSTSKSDINALERDSLQRLAVKIDKALPKVKDRLTAIHLSNSRKDIERILDNKYSASQSSGMSIYDFLFGADAKKQLLMNQGCFSAFSHLPLELQMEFQEEVRHELNEANPAK